eukprot:c11889_g1_i1 orf=488-1807(-)
MAFLFSRVRTRLSLLSHVLEHNYRVFPDVYLANFYILGVQALPRQLHQNPSHSHARVYTLKINFSLKGEKMHAESSTHTEMLGFVQASKLLQTAAIMEAGTRAGVQKLSHRSIQTFSESTWDHPWSRDKLSERMSFLRARRIAKERLKQRLRRRAALFQYSSSLPEMPLPSQPLEGVLQPTTAEAERVSPLLARTDLIITRNIEWANLLAGFEQENRYVIMDPRESLTVVGYITESSNWLFRQFLRTRRPFHAAIMDAAGSVLFTVRRPIWFINSTIYAEVDGKVVGFAKRRWHLWRRIYDVYRGDRQFAVVVNPGFWNWTFTLKDENERVLAEIDRHFRGFGYEMLTDAGQYAIRFGDVASGYHPPTKAHTLTAKKTNPSQLQGINANPELEAEQFISERPLDLLERTVTLALAISLDNDYFSRHGGFVPFPFFSEEP